MPTYTDWKVITYKFIDYETNILRATFGKGLRLNLVTEICKINVMFIMKLRWSALIKLSNCKCRHLLKLQHICEDQMLLFLIFISRSNKIYLTKLWSDSSTEEKNPLMFASLPKWGFVDQMVAAPTKYLGGLGSTPVEAWSFLASFLLLLNSISSKL